MFAVFIFLYLTSATASVLEKTESVADLCAKYLGKDMQYSIVLREDGTYAQLSGSVMPAKVRMPITKILSKIEGGPELLENVPELGDLDWTPDGRSVYSAVSQFINYQIERDGYLTIEMQLPSNDFGHQILRTLLDILERERVVAMVSGNRAQVSVYRLELQDASTQRALKEFLTFMRSVGISHPMS
jgi:hypothetical protein